MTFESATATEQSLAQGNETPEPSTILREMARTALSEADGNMERAFDLMRQRVGERVELTAYLIDQGCHEWLRHENAAMRKKLERQAWSADSAAGDRIAVRARSEGVYDWPLPGGKKKLGYANLTDIQEAKKWHENQSSGHVARAKFYASIERRMKRAKAKTVRECLDEQQIEQMLQESGDE